jgi:hypothetical protein
VSVIRVREILPILSLINEGGWGDFSRPEGKLKASVKSLLRNFKFQISKECQNPNVKGIAKYQSAYFLLFEL